MRDDDVIALEAPAPKETPEEGKKKTTAKDPIIMTFETVETYRREIGLWTGRWSPEYLLRKREEMGGREFDRGFRQMAISDEELTWQEGWINQCVDRSFIAVEQVNKSSRWLPYIRVGGCDLSVAEEEKEGSFFVVSIIAMDENGHRWLLWVERHRGLTLRQQAHLVADLSSRFGVHIMAVESVGYQDILRRELETYYPDVPVEPFYTESKHKLDTLIGIPSLASEFEGKRWHLPYGDARSKRMVDPFIEEMRVHPLPGHHDDIIMATYFARESFRVKSTPKPRIDVIRY